MSERIERLIAQMTLDEKISLLAGIDLWHSVPVERLGIPSFRVTDGPNGARGAFGNLESTSACTPVGVALGATWNAELVEQVGRVLGEETRSKDAQILLAPTVNIQRSPTAGRNFECFSEDPYLSGVLASAVIRGIQSQGVGACIKHFVCNDQEFDRFEASVEIQPRPLHEIYLEPFRIAVRESQPWALMSAYNRINGFYASEHEYLLKTILRERWGFDGVVISDWYGTYSPNVPGGGVELEMPGPARWMAGEHVEAALASGALTEKELDEKVRRSLVVIEKAKLFERGTLRPDISIDKPEHRKIIRQAAQEAIVLLKNATNLLPLDVGRCKRIAVIGENALRSQVLGGGSSAVAPHYVVSILDGIREYVPNDVAVEYALGCFTHRHLPAPAPEYLATEDGQRGLVIEFFDNLDCSGEAAYRLVSERVSFGWFDDSVPNVNQECFSARMSGYLLPQVSGLHDLALNMVGCGRLYLDDDLVIDAWEAGDMPTQIQLELQAGRKYKLRIEYKWEGDKLWRCLALGYLPPHADDLMAEAIALAEWADVVVLVAGMTPEWEAESFDRPDMLLPGMQNELIEKVAGANANTIVVLNCGSPVEMPWLDQAAGVLQLWYDSQEQGHALADVLFGDVSPSGRLPLSFPRRLQDNPAYLSLPGENGKIVYGEGIFVGYRYYDEKGIELLFPFGYGLSYTQFEYSNLQLSADIFSGVENIEVSVDVQNVGSCQAMEVIQVYVRPVGASLRRPKKELKAFAKCLLEVGEMKKITLKLDREAFWFFDPAKDGWVVEAGEFEILVGASSRDIRLQRKITVHGKVEEK